MTEVVWVKWYWVIFFSNTVPNPFVADSSDLGNFDERDFMKGRRVKGWSPHAWLKATKPENNGDPDDLLSNLHALPVFSGRFQARLRSAGIKGIQYLPVRVFRPNGEVIPGYALANVLSLVSALDTTRSKVEYFPEDHVIPEKRGKVRDVRRVVLTRSKLRGIDVARLAELPPDLYVSDRFRDVFASSGFTGCSFRPVRVA